MEYDDSERTVIVAEVMTPEKANFIGTVHGGDILKMLDRVAYACAARYSGSTVVTLSVDQVFFKEPIFVGELVTCHANVNYVGTTSMEIGIKVFAENLKQRTKRHTNSCYLTMVAVDDNCKPIPIHPLKLTTDLQKQRFEEALIRKDMRRKFSAEHQERKKMLKKNPPL